MDSTETELQECYDLMNSDKISERKVRNATDSSIIYIGDQTTTHNFYVYSSEGYNWAERSIRKRRSHQNTQRYVKEKNWKWHSLYMEFILRSESQGSIEGSWLYF